jgi:hypothetical protein
VITRGKLDEGGHFSKLNEAAWEKARLELAHLVDENPNAQSLLSVIFVPLPGVSRGRAGASLVPVCCHGREPAPALTADAGCWLL